MQEDESSAINAMRSGDIAGLEILVRRHQLHALRVAYNLCGNQQLAEDAVTEAFLAVQRHIGTYDTSRPFTPWFYRIVINHVRSAVRRQGRVPTIGDARDVLRYQVDPAPDAESQVIQAELNDELLRHIDELPKKQREVVILRYYLDMDERTVSASLRVPVGTVKWRLFQARKRLRHHLSQGSETHHYRYQEGHGS